MASNIEVFLKINEKQYVCNKEDLINNSDYFNAMFKGNFEESYSNIVTLKDVDPLGLELLLEMLKNKNFELEMEHVLLILDTACILQFLDIRNKCVDFLTTNLSPSNCLKTWIATECHGIVPLSLKAKCMALNDFQDIRYSEDVVELNLNDLIRYLGHTHLETTNEGTVFEVSMNWWSENNQDFERDSRNNLIKLLSTIDWKGVSDKELQKIMSHSIFLEYPALKNVLACMILFKLGRTAEELVVSNEERELAKKLYDCKRRYSLKYPCFLAIRKCLGEKKSEPPKKVKCEEYKTEVIYHDMNKNSFKYFFPIDKPEHINLEGFKLIGYKHQVLVFGGEYILGKGNWNYSFWAYDTISERWHQKTVLPVPRRHFESCMVGDLLFIIGGTANFRVLQDNMYYFDFEKEVWSKAIKLPIADSQTKCCDYLGKLFIINLINNPPVYAFNTITSNWFAIDVIDKENVLGTLMNYNVFSNCNSLFIRGYYVIVELISVNYKTLKVGKVINLSKEFSCDVMESMLCGNLIYTMSKDIAAECDTYSLQQYNLETQEAKYVFHNVPDSTELDVDDRDFKIKPYLKVFPFRHYKLAEDDLINDKFL